MSTSSRRKRAVASISTPPLVKTDRAEPQGTQAVLEGELLRILPGDRVQVGFQWRPAAAFADKLYNDQPWAEVMAGEMSTPGAFKATLPLPPGGTGYDIRAFARHPRLVVEGDTIVLRSLH